MELLEAGAEPVDLVEDAVVSISLKLSVTFKEY